MEFPNYGFFDEQKAAAEQFKQVIIAHQERQLERMISGGECHTIGLRSDGTVLAIGANQDSECNVSDWKDIIAVSAGTSHTIGLRADGTVIATGYDRSRECNVSEWKEVIAVAAGYCHTVGLRADGTVIAAGYFDENGMCNVSDWMDIIAVSAGYFHTMGLRANGSIIVTGDNTDDQHSVVNWKNIATPQSYADFVKKMQAQMAEHKVQRETEIKAITAEINKLQGQVQEQEAIYTANAKKLFGEGARIKKSAQAEMERLKAQIAELEKRIAELGGDKL